MLLVPGNLWNSWESSYPGNAAAMESFHGLFRLEKQVVSAFRLRTLGIPWEPSKIFETTSCANSRVANRRQTMKGCHCTAQ